VPVEIEIVQFLLKLLLKQFLLGTTISTDC